MSNAIIGVNGPGIQEMGDGNAHRDINTILWAMAKSEQRSQGH